MNFYNIGTEQNRITVQPRLLAYPKIKIKEEVRLTDVKNKSKKSKCPTKK